MSNFLSDYPVKKPCTAIEIEDWLVAQFAYILGVEPSEVDTNRPLDSYGFDSAQAIIIANKIQKYLGIKVSLIHLWYYPTIKELAQRLAEDFASSQSEILQL
jgi:acyl carrier protein